MAVMGDKEALDLVYEAAQRWADELGQYIIPGADDEEDAASYQQQLDRLNEALEVLA